MRCNATIEYERGVLDCETVASRTRNGVAGRAEIGVFQQRFAHGPPQGAFHVFGKTEQVVRDWSPE